MEYLGCVSCDAMRENEFFHNKGEKNSHWRVSVIVNAQGGSLLNRQVEHDDRYKRGEAAERFPIIANPDRL